MLKKLFTQTFLIYLLIWKIFLPSKESLENLKNQSTNREAVNFLLEEGVGYSIHFFPFEDFATCKATSCLGKSTEKKKTGHSE
jgi:hypothetical protein